MGKRAELLVTTDWLAEHLDDPALRIVDMRGMVRTVEIAPGHDAATYLGAVDAYAAGHIPGAVYLDWTRDIIDPDDTVPVQIAPHELFAAAMERAGIGDDTLVVAYDAHPAMQFATRLWWDLRFYGHDRAAVLDGGLPKWLREGRAVTTEMPQIVPAHFTPHLRPQLRVTADELLLRLGKPKLTLLDARDAAQYSGQRRRNDGRAGHIPGAINIPREQLIDEASGTFLADDELAAAFHAAGVPDEGELIAYCNGGVAATSVLFALSLLGQEDGANYDGSWNEWGSRADLPVE